MLTVAVLGPVEVRRDGERIPMPSGKTTGVLGVVRQCGDLWSGAARRPVSKELP